MDCDYEELYKWVEEHTITRPKRHINRDFSDAIPLVEILKQHFPKLVDTHNYTPKNSLAQKLINWETLNMKVLKKLKINLNKKKIEQLANAELGAVEKLLLEVKKKIDVKSSGDDNEAVYYLEGNPTSEVGKVPNGATKKMIPAAVFEKMQSDLEEKSEAVDILKSKVDHLENLLNIKEERIKDLSQQLQTIVNQGVRPDSAQASKFFGFFQSTNNINDPIKNE